MLTYENYMASADYIKARLSGFMPKILIILGSGLGFLGEEIQDPISIDYCDVPSFRKSTAPGHEGRFVAGMLAGVPVLAMKGRMHFYEGYSGEEVAYPVRVAKLLGVSGVIITNACGGINLSFDVGELMIISDHIKLFGLNPLTGPNLPEFGPRFCDMSYAYTPEYRIAAKKHAEELGIKLHEGVYCYFTGPQYETPAEICAARTLGADVAGMSTAPEAIAAAHCSMEILGISLVTNMAAGVLPQKLDQLDVLAAAAKGKADFSSLIRACLPDMCQ